MRRFRMRGMSLVELMIALTIGLIILAAVSTVFVNSKATYTTQESVARLQESARFALHFLARDLRMTGYYGCAGGVESVNSTLNPSGTNASAYDFTNPIEALVGTTLYPSNTAVSFPSSGVGAQWPGTAGLAIRMADASNPIELQKTMPNTSAAAFLGTGHGLEAGDIVVLSDCASADIFQITNVGGGNGETVVHNSGSGSPGNSTQKLSRVYEEGEAHVMKFVHRLYYIGTGASGHPSLFRVGLDGSDRQELVEGIENLQLTFGVDTAGDGTPRVYLPATDTALGTDPAKWANVVSTRVTLTVRPTINGAVSAAPNPNEVEDREFVSTVLMRNLQ